jgi:hypothetical protein
MTAAPQGRGPRKGTVRDLRALAVAFALLAVCGSVWVWKSRNAVERRERVLAGVPPFPARGQQQRPRPSPPVRPADPSRLAPPPLPAAPVRPTRPDPLTSFVLQPSHDIAVVHVNALLNTPLFERIKQCLPAEWGQFTEAAARMGIDVERDVDRFAFSADGMAMSGFFEGKPIARNIAANWPDLEERQYRGHSMWLSSVGGIAQAGNLLVWGRRDSMERLVDRALDPPPAGADPQDVYGDLFYRTDLGSLRASSGGSTEPDVVRAILDGLSGVTVRANVWDTVSVSLEGSPQGGRSVADLAGMARGAIALARENLDPGNVELATLLDLAKVQGSADALSIDLALPMNDIFDKLHFPCPGASDAGAREGSASR